MAMIMFLFNFNMLFNKCRSRGSRFNCYKRVNLWDQTVCRLLLCRPRHYMTPPFCAVGRRAMR